MGPKGKRGPKKKSAAEISYSASIEAAKNWVIESFSISYITSIVVLRGSLG
jgi:hypothetical protein